MIVGCSKAIRSALQLCERYARTDLPILIIGATGTGKEIFAQHVHRLSGRRGDPVDVNCGAMPRDMVESLLFGHRRGAFTGAVETRIGYLEQADGGTLLLDELGSLPPEAQVKLLRVIETGLVQRLGDTSKRRVDARIIAAAQEHVPQDVQYGRFRRDLYQRLAGVVIQLPPLSKRCEDVIPLAEHFAALKGRILEPGVSAVLLNYGWPGNVRELRLAIERATYLVPDGTLSPAAVAEGISLGVPTESSQTAHTERRAVPRNHTFLDADRLLAACEATAWDVEAAARSLGMSRASLYRRLRTLHVARHRIGPSQSH